jgi:hypothetical protein
MSDDYTRISTPSTEDVREYFAFGDSHTWSERVPDRYELFDRWLAEHDRQVAETAWCAGLDAGHFRWYNKESFGLPPINPYRKKTQ